MIDCILLVLYTILRGVGDSSAFFVREIDRDTIPNEDEVDNRENDLILDSRLIPADRKGIPVIIQSSNRSNQVQENESKRDTRRRWHPIKA